MNRKSVIESAIASGVENEIRRLCRRRRRPPALRIRRGNGSVNETGSVSESAKSGDSESAIGSGNENAIGNHPVSRVSGNQSESGNENESGIWG